MAQEKVHDIVVMPGDGIGKICTEQALRVLGAVGFKANYHHGDIGWQFWKTEGNALPQRTIDLIEKYKIGLFGAITSKPKKEADAELDPKLKAKVPHPVYYSPIVTMRQKFNLDLCVRPCRSILGNPLNFIRRTASGGFEEPKIDIVVFRQNTECLYCGVEWTDPPPKVMEGLSTHPKFAPFTKVQGKDLAVSLRIATRPCCERICRAAFEYARKYHYPTVTVAEKPNVVRETSGMMEEEAKKMAKNYPEIAIRSDNIDACMMYMTKSPESYAVVISSNMFGDIASDGFAGLTGGLGFAASGNIGPDIAVFEPTHGSAPKYEKLDPPIPNPSATILAAAMMLEHIGETGKARMIRTAVANVVAEGKVRTYDMMKIPGGPNVVKMGAASTITYTDAVIAQIKAMLTVTLCPTYLE